MLKDSDIRNVESNPKDFQDDNILKSIFSLIESLDDAKKLYLINSLLQEQRIKELEKRQESERPEIGAMVDIRYRLLQLEEEYKTNLTKREKEILKYVVEGFTSREIADKLFLSQRTVDNHRSNIMKKLNFTKSKQMMRYFLV